MQNTTGMLRKMLKKTRFLGSYNDCNSGWSSIDVEWRGLFGWNSDLRALFGDSLKEKVVFSMRKVPFVLIESEGRQKN